MKTERNSAVTATTPPHPSGLVGRQVPGQRSSSMITLLSVLVLASLTWPYKQVNREKEPEERDKPDKEHPSGQPKVVASPDLSGERHPNAHHNPGDEQHYADEPRSPTSEDPPQGPPDDEAKAPRESASIDWEEDCRQIVEASDPSLKLQEVRLETLK